MRSWKLLICRETEDLKSTWTITAFIRTYWELERKSKVAETSVRFALEPPIERSFGVIRIQVNALQFLDLCDCDRVSAVSRERRPGCLHILSYKRHHPFTLVGIGHVL